MHASATSLLVVQGAFPMAIFMVWLINVADWIRDLAVRCNRRRRSRKSSATRTSRPGWCGTDRKCASAWQRFNSARPWWSIRASVLPWMVPYSAARPWWTRPRSPANRSRSKEEGALVYAATVVREGKLYICAERIGNATEAAQILRLVEAAPARETKIQNYAVKWRNDLVPYSFVGGAIGAVIGGGLQGAAAVLVVDYGTGIRIAAPTTVLSGMTKAIRNGILIKGGRALESLAEVDAVVFDKTGTLTTGHPDILDVVSINGSTADEVLVLAAAAEQRMTHPVADAIVRAAEARQLSIPDRTASDYSLGLGVEAIVNDSVVLVGSPRFMTARGLILSPEAQEHISRMQQQAISPLCVAKDGVVIGLLSISDPLRPEARDVVQALRDRGIKHIVMLTGDHKDVARRIAAELGITEYMAEVFRETSRRRSSVCSVRGIRSPSSGMGSTTLPCWPMPT